MNYFSRPEVSNSDLSALKDYLYGDAERPDPTEAYKFGSLIDAMITEPELVDYFRLTCNGEQYTKEQFEQAEQMKKAFMRDQLAAMMLKESETQKVMTKTREFNHNGMKFFLPVRCKWDLWMPKVHWGGDIKSTVATTQKQFEDAARFFDYDRQRAWYMDIAGSNQDILIAISKKNFKVFKKVIRRGDKFYTSGKEKYNDLAFKYWFLIAA